MTVKRVLPTGGIRIPCVANVRFTAHCGPSRRGKLNMRMGGNVRANTQRGPIRWKANPVVADTHCELTLNSGEWDAAKNTFNSLYRIKVNWQDWSESGRDSLLREFNATRKEAIEQSKKDNQIKGRVFFVGTQDANHPSILHVDNYRFICCFAARIVWPKK